MMTTRDKLASRIVKHGLCAAFAALLLGASAAIAGQILQRSVTAMAGHAQIASIVSTE